MNKDKRTVKNFDWFKINGEWYHCVWVQNGVIAQQFVNGICVHEQEVECVKFDGTESSVS